MMNVLVTGISGFTGTHLSVTLKKAGFKVFGLSNHKSSVAGNLFQCDLLDKPRLQDILKNIQPDYVIHLAAISFVGHDNVDDFYRVNVVGTMNLLGVLSTLNKKPSKVLVASSANIYGTPEVEAIDEAVLPGPVNHYAASKLAMEYMVRTVFDDLPIVVTRPFNYTGVGQTEQFLIPKIVSHFKRNAAAIELGNLNVSRDFSDVRDIVAIYVKLLTSNVQSIVVNVCSGRAVALANIIDMMNEIAGYKIEVQVNSDFIRANEIPSLRGNNDYLRSLIGIVPKTPLSETLKWMYESRVLK